MKLATLRTNGTTTAARLDGEVFTEIEGYPDLGALLAEENWQQIAADASGPTHPAAGAELETIVADPGKVLCVGLNYKSHIQEMGRDLQGSATIVSSSASAAGCVGPEASAAMPRQFSSASRAPRSG